MAFFRRLFGSGKKDSSPPPPSGGGGDGSIGQGMESIDNAIELLEKREQVLEKKISLETQKAKDFLVKKNKAGALSCLKRKKQYEEQVAKIQGQKDNMETLRIAMQDSAMNRQILEAQRRAGHQLSGLNKQMNAEQVEDDMDKIREELEQAQQVSEALTQPIDGNVIDETDLEAELAQLMGPTKVSEPRVSTGGELEKMPKVPVQPLPQPAVAVAEKDEDAMLKELEAELNA